MIDPLDEALEDATPSCPKCLVRLDVAGEELPHLVCPVCGMIWL